MPNAPGAIVQVPALLQASVTFRVHDSLIRTIRDAHRERFTMRSNRRKKGHYETEEIKEMVYILNRKGKPLVMSTTSSWAKALLIIKDVSTSFLRGPDATISSRPKPLRLRTEHRQALLHDCC